MITKVSDCYLLKTEVYLFLLRSLVFDQIISPDDLIDVQFRNKTQNKDELINIKEQLDILNQTLQKVESQPYKVTISSAPATIAGNIGVKPTGTSLSLKCKTGNSNIRSMNFADLDIFTWYPWQVVTL